MGSATGWPNHGIDSGARGYLVGGARFDTWFGDSQDSALHCDVGEGAERKAKDGDRDPSVELTESEPADSDSDHLWRETCRGGE